MCSTATGAYGCPARKTEVPRTALMDALESQTGNRLVRSDWVRAGEKPIRRPAGTRGRARGIHHPGQLYIDYIL